MRNLNEHSSALPWVVSLQRPRSAPPSSKAAAPRPSPSSSASPAANAKCGRCCEVSDMRRVVVGRRCGIVSAFLRSLACGVAAVRNICFGLDRAGFSGFVRFCAYNILGSGQVRVNRASPETWVVGFVSVSLSLGHGSDWVQVNLTFPRTAVRFGFGCEPVSLFLNTAQIGVRSSFEFFGSERFFESDQILSPLHFSR